jgi:hypothetical protein
MDRKIVFLYGLVILTGSFISCRKGEGRCVYSAKAAGRYVSRDLPDFETLEVTLFYFEMGVQT